jgi:hypothetical protein
MVVDQSGVDGEMGARRASWWEYHIQQSIDGLEVEKWKLESRKTSISLVDEVC